MSSDFIPTHLLPAFRAQLAADAADPRPRAVCDCGQVYRVTDPAATACPRCVANPPARLALVEIRVEQLRAGDVLAGSMFEVTAPVERIGARARVHGHYPGRADGVHEWKARTTVRVFRKAAA